ncbi:amidohydrolase family protein [Halorientalis marina]|jgi:predicted TIM-barrel fold metal-dependent hydrolase|uniref:amidohydrolase family protein n=1 Tax=Halorientalis marina TaxID=2931976 RepID=UPI001FF1F4C4|nr:amidohydrolase family protein [Halorientalis marina]
MSQQQGKHEVLKEETLVDADVHLAIPEEDLIPYLDEPHKSRMKHTYLGQSSRDGWDRTVGGKIEMDLDGVQSPEKIQESLCDEFHIDHPLINTFGLMSRNPEPEWSIALMKAHNDLLLDQFLDGSNFKGLATITTQRPEAAAEELDRMGDEEDIVGFYVHNTGTNPPLGDPHYDIMWQAAEDNNLNVAFHGSANGFMYEFPRQNQALNQFMEVHVLAHPWSHMLTVTSLIVEGVVEKFPDLEFGFLEAGLGWIPYLMWRLNKEYSIRRSEAPLLEKSPEEYIKEKMYFASQPIGEPNNNSHMESLIDIIGTESILFATDYPHWDFDSPEALDKHLQSTYSPEERKQVLSGNSAELFDLNI